MCINANIAPGIRQSKHEAEWMSRQDHVSIRMPDGQVLLRAPNTAEAGSTNRFGDQQLAADVAADHIVFDALCGCGAVASASSEETPGVQNMGGSGYSVRPAREHSALLCSVFQQGLENT